MSKYIKLQENVYNTYLALKNRKKQQEFLEKCFIYAWEGKEIDTKDSIISIAFLGVKPSLKISETSINWGGSRDNSGRKPNQDDNQDEIKLKSSDNQEKIKSFISNKDISNEENIKEKYKKEFDEFWLIYPKQRAGSKEKAYKSFCKAIDEKRVTIEKIMESVKLYSKSDEVAKGFAKGCAAWLNDDRFNNFYKQEPKEEYKYWL